jgi:hypothetical protein
MILNRQPPRRLPGASGPTGSAPVSKWLRRAVSDTQSLAGTGVEDVALAAGAAVGALDAVVRRQERWAGAWRQRLAFAAAAVAVKQARRVEDEAALRDAVLLTRAGGDPGPAGRMLLAWREMSARPVAELLEEAGIARALTNLGHASNDAAARELAEELRQARDAEGAVGALGGVFAIVERRGYSRAFGSWLADAALAQRLGWNHAVPLLGMEPNAAGSTKSLLAAQARSALRAIDLSAELERRAEKLLAVAPKLRAKAADVVIEKLLSEDAIVASGNIPGMSDRGLRRLFDRLVELGAVRELSGRSTFRIYGL